MPKETNEVLTWIFDRIPCIIDVMKAKIQGEGLEVEGLGTFTIDSHLGDDSKTINCVPGYEQSATLLILVHFL